MKPFSEASDRNQGPILEVLRQHLAQASRVLEIGSGTGQHAVHFAAGLPHLHWQPTDQPEHLLGISQWVEEAALPNLHRPLPLWAVAGDAASGLASTDPSTFQSLLDDGEQAPGFDAVFTANTLHIMGWPEVRALFAGLPTMLREGPATLIAYGPFNRDGQFTSESNRAFDAWLKARDPRSGIRDAADVDRLAQAHGFALIDDVAMPANNRMLVWRRR